MGRLWGDNAVFSIGDVLNRSRQSAKNAVSFMGAGRPIASLGQMKRADVFLIGTPDDRLADCCRDLADSGLLEADNIVFHCSGAIRSAELGSAKERGASIASVHPVKSFADPALCIETFAGTYCGIEGDPDAVPLLSHGFEAVGGRMFSIDPEYKEIYHAASVFSCNYLVAVLEIGLKAYARAGIPRETAFAIGEPIVRETIDNVLKLDTTDALTGPIARGDHRTVVKQIAALNAWEREYCELYKRLGNVALALSRSQGTASEESLDALSRLLDN